MKKKKDSSHQTEIFAPENQDLQSQVLQRKYQLCSKLNFASCVENLNQDSDTILFS